LNNLIKTDAAFQILRLFIAVIDKKIAEVESKNSKMEKEIAMWRRE